MLFGPIARPAASFLIRRLAPVLPHRVLYSSLPAMASEIAASTSSPPSKRQRVQSPPLAEAAPAVASSSSSTSAPAPSSNGSTSRPAPVAHSDKHFLKKVKAKEKARQVTLSKTGEDPIWYDIVSILGQDKVDSIKANNGIGHGEWEEKFARGHIVEARVLRLSANGQGVMLAPEGDWVLTVPHVMPGELVKVRVDRNERLHSKCDLIEVLEKSEERRDDLVGCKYFGECAGCQYQVSRRGEKRSAYKQRIDAHASLARR